MPWLNCRIAGNGAPASIAVGFGKQIVDPAEPRKPSQSACLSLYYCQDNRESSLGNSLDAISPSAVNENDRGRASIEAAISCTAQ